VLEGVGAAAAQAEVLSVPRGVHQGVADLARSATTSRMSVQTPVDSSIMLR
jgi:hypothetical protein